MVIFSYNFNNSSSFYHFNIDFWFKLPRRAEPRRYAGIRISIWNGSKCESNESKLSSSSNDDASGGSTWDGYEWKYILIFLQCLLNIVSNDDHNMNYYQEYCRLFIANVVLTNQMKELVSEKNELLAKLAKLEVIYIYIINLLYS